MCQTHFNFVQSFTHRWQKEYLRRLIGATLKRKLIEREFNGTKTFEVALGQATHIFPSPLTSL